MESWEQEPTPTSTTTYLAPRKPGASPFQAQKRFPPHSLLRSCPTKQVECGTLARRMRLAWFYYYQDIELTMITERTIINIDGEPVIHLDRHSEGTQSWMDGRSWHEQQPPRVTKTYKAGPYGATLDATLASDRLFQKMAKCQIHDDEHSFEYWAITANKECGHPKLNFRKTDWEAVSDSGKHADPVQYRHSWRS